jgi:PQQ-like domain
MRFANGLLYTGSSALHPTTGAAAWNAPGEVVDAVTQDVALMGARADLVGRNPVTGQFIWRAVGANRTAAGMYDPVVGGSLVFSGHPHVVNVLSLADGTPLGTTPAVGLDMDIIPSGARVFVDGSGTLYAFRAGTVIEERAPAR